MTFKLLLALAMSAVVLVGCEDSTGSLHKLCASSDATVSQVRECLDLGADVNARDKEGWTPLIWAAKNNSNSEVISLLLGAGAEVNAKSKYGWTPLMWAALVDEHPEVVSVLLKAGAEVNAKGRDGVTPLMYAAQYNENPEVISVLLKAGADANASDIQGYIALGYARWGSNLDGTQALKELEAATNP